MDRQWIEMVDLPGSQRERTKRRAPLTLQVPTLGGHIFGLVVEPSRPFGTGDKPRFELGQRHSSGKITEGLTPEQ